MIRSKFGLKALSLCIVLAGIPAFTGVAQAEVGAFWLVNGSEAPSTLLLSVEAETDVVGTLLTTLGGMLVDIKCQKLKLIEARLEGAFSPGKFFGKVLFHNCDFLSLKNGVATLQKACEPFIELGGIKDNGLIETNALTGLIKLHEAKVGAKEAVLEVTPTEFGGLLATINLGPECAFGEILKIGGPLEKGGGGVFFLKDCLGQFSTNVVKHLVEELKALTKMTVNGGLTTATIDGSAWAFLSRIIHKGLTFSGIPA